MRLQLNANVRADAMDLRRDMLSTVLRNAARARYLWYTAVAGAFTLLLAVVTVRFTLGGVSFESFVLAALTFALAFQTRRWYRRFCGGADTMAPGNHRDHTA
jgi:hypothetical protein